jgi:hypothetical protein
LSDTNAADTVQSLLSDIKKWTKSAYARNGECGVAVNANSLIATCWCLTGALYRKHGTENYYVKSVRADEKKVFLAIHKLFPGKVQYPKDIQDKFLSDPDSYPGAIHGQIMTFNDLSETTFSDILLVIKEANV